MAILLTRAHPDLVSQWHEARNGALDPGVVTAGSKRVVWWRCEAGHEWEARIAHRATGVGCPFCSGRRPSPETALTATHPKLCAEWHPTKNGTLTPAQVSRGSMKRIVWRCGDGHEWEATVSLRTLQGTGCPECAIAKERGRAKRRWGPLPGSHPDLCREWHPEKNAHLLPEEMSAGSRRVVWWRCEDGHEWEASVGSRALRGTGCPFCSHHRASPETSLAALHPALGEQWHVEKNPCGADEVLPVSNVRAWWRCESGHAWRATPQNRTVAGQGCPYCAGKRPTPETCLSVTHPEIAAEWHPEKNGYLTPEDVTRGSEMRIYWLCSFGHAWRASVNQRTAKGSGCPVCVGRRARA